MMNPVYYFARMRELPEEFQPGRERALAAAKLDECEMWLAKCTPTPEALARDMASADPRGSGGAGGGAGGGQGGNAYATGTGSTAVGGGGGGGSGQPGEPGR